MISQIVGEQQALSSVFPAALTRTKLWQTAVATFSLVLFTLLCIVIPSSREHVFNSPDETSNFLFTELYANEGKLWYTKSYTNLDVENLLHPRGAITQGDRVVPYSYLGLPVVYGMMSRVIGTNQLVYALALTGISIWALYRTTAILFGAKLWEVSVTLLGFTPLIYHLNKPFMNAAPALVCVFVAAWLFARYARTKNRINFVLVCIFCSFSIFFRYEYVLFISPLVFWGLYVLHRSMGSREIILDTAIFVVVVLVVFAVPMAILNQEVYGSWKLYGNELFAQVYFPERGGSPGASLLENGFKSIRKILLPSYPFDPGQVALNLFRLTAGLMPVFTLAGVVGGLKAVASRHAKWQNIAPLALLTIYGWIYLGSGNTWGATGTASTFDTAILRYWLLFFTLLFFLAVYGITKMGDSSAKAALILGIVLTGPLSVYSFSDGNILSIRHAEQEYSAWGQNELVPATESNAIIYASRSDKKIVPFRDTATWWNGDEFYNSETIAASMSRVAATGRPVYLYREREVDLDAISTELAKSGLTITPVGKTGLYRVEALTSASTQAGR